MSTDEPFHQTLTGYLTNLISALGALVAFVVFIASMNSRIKQVDQKVDQKVDNQRLINGVTQRQLNEIKMLSKTTNDSVNRLAVNVAIALDRTNLKSKKIP